MPIVIANGGANFITGTDGNDLIYADGGNDTVSGGLGNDTIDGGDGLDTCLYGSTSLTNSISMTGTAVSVAGPEGVDVLRNVERVVFVDRCLALDLNAAAGEAANVIGAALGKAGFANLPIVGVVLGYMDKGGTADSAASLLVQAGVIADLAGGADNTSVLRYVLNNLGLQSSSRLESILNTQGQEAFFKVAVSGYENILNVDLVGLAKTGLAYV